MVRGNERQNFLSHLISTTGTSLAVSAGSAVAFRLLFTFVRVDLANISRNKHNIFLLLYAQIKNLFMRSVCISSYGCTREVWRARKMRKSCTRR